MSCQITLKELPISFLYHKYCNIKTQKECSVKLILSHLILLPVFKIFNSEIKSLFKFLSSHGSDCLNCDLKGFDTMHSYRWIVMFRRNVLPPASGLKCIGKDFDIM
jgi:hypothetical protein